MQKNVLVIITGSIAAYKSIELIRDLEKKSYKVKVILTESAQKFITKLLLSSLIGNENVYTDMFKESDSMTHINLSREADLIVVTPASANFIAKIANGYCDDLASTAISAANKDILIAPAMNHKMWLSDANINNIEKIQNSSHITVIQPVKDVLACKEVGIGKMADIKDISNEIDEYFNSSKILQGKTVIITGGGTREAIDSVRFIGNNSSGKQAVALSNAFRKYGAEVLLIAANINININLPEKKISRVRSCDEMMTKVQSVISNHSNLENLIFVSCAAVADYKAKSVSTIKIKKTSADSINIELVKNVDILKTISNSQSRPKLVVGFAAEDGQDIIKKAKHKLESKNCDLLVANDIKKGSIFNSDSCDANLITSSDLTEYKKINKNDLATKIVKKVIALL